MHSCLAMSPEFPDGHVEDAGKIALTVTLLFAVLHGPVKEMLPDGVWCKLWCLVGDEFLTLLEGIGEAVTFLNTLRECPLVKFAMEAIKDQLSSLTE